MSKDVKASKENDYGYSYSDSLKHWRAWGSWYSWGSPVGLALGWFIFILGLSIFLYFLHLVGWI